MVGSSSLQHRAQVNYWAPPASQAPPHTALPGPDSPLTAQFALPAWLGAWFLSDSWLFRFLGIFAFAFLSREPSEMWTLWSVPYTEYCTNTAGLPLTC